MSDVTSSPGAPGAGRHAVLVDAGYLYASVGQLMLGRTSRREFRVATEPLIEALLARAAERVPGELLRMYWYDAARDRVPTVEQRQIAALPHVKVRLGNLNSAGQQKGVDAQLRQDLELLARHRAVTDVVLLAGDEDMVPAVEAAQAYGVRVHVWGVEPPYGVNQAERLVWEADTVGQLDAEFCRPYLEVDAEPATAEPVEAVDAAARPEADRPLMPTPAEVFAARKLPAPGHHVHAGTNSAGMHAAGSHTIGSHAAGTHAAGTVAAGPRSVPERPGPDRPEMEQIGARIAARWLLTRGRENVADLLPGPVLPTVIDKELLVEAEEEISRSLRPYEEARRALRDGFWAKLQQEFGIKPPEAPPAGDSGPPDQAAAVAGHHGIQRLGTQPPAGSGTQPPAGSGTQPSGGPAPGTQPPAGHGPAPGTQPSGGPATGTQPVGHGPGMHPPTQPSGPRSPGGLPPGPPPGAQPTHRGAPTPA